MISKFLTDLPRKTNLQTNDLILIEDVNGLATKTTSIANFLTLVGAISSPFMRNYATNIGNGSLTEFTITHNLNTRDVITSVYDNTTYKNIKEHNITNTTTNTVSVSFNTAPGTNAYRVVVIM